MGEMGEMKRRVRQKEERQSETERREAECTRKCVCEQSECPPPPPYRASGASGARASHSYLVLKTLTARPVIPIFLFMLVISSSSFTDGSSVELSPTAVLSVVKFTRGGKRTSGEGGG